MSLNQFESTKYKKRFSSKSLLRLNSDLITHKCARLILNLFDWLETEFRCIFGMLVPNTNVKRYGMLVTKITKLVSGLHRCW